jgi:CBS domain-containing protein
MHIARILNAKGDTVFSIHPEIGIADALKTLAQHDVGALLVCESDGRVCGILSERDIVRAMARQGADCLQRPARALMSSELVCCAPEDDVETAMALMTERRVRHLPVMADGRLLGLISIGDVVKHRIEEVQREAEAMRDYISAAG